MKKALLISAALLGAVSFAGAQSLKVGALNSAVDFSAYNRAEGTLQWCGEAASAIGAGEDVAYSFDQAGRWDAEDLAEFSDGTWSVVSVEFAINAVPTKATPMVWDADGAILAQGDLFEFPEPGFYTLNVTHKLVANENYHIGIRINTEKDYPAVTDAGPATPGYGDLMRFEEEDGTYGGFVSIKNQWGIDKNNYLIVHLSNEGTSINAILTNDPANAYVQNGVINVTGANGRQVSLYNMNGQLVYSGVDTTIPAQKGMYVLRVGARSFKLAI